MYITNRSEVSYILLHRRVVRKESAQNNSLKPRKVSPPPFHAFTYTFNLLQKLWIPIQVRPLSFCVCVCVCAKKIVLGGMSGRHFTKFHEASHLTTTYKVSMVLWRACKYCRSRRCHLSPALSWLHSVMRSSLLHSRPAVQTELFSIRVNTLIL